MSKNFFLTGCASGIGRALAGALHKQGHRVYATDINYDGLKEAAWPSDRVTIRKLDVCDADEWEEVFDDAVETLDGIDVSMNIAGYLGAGWIQEQSTADIDRHIDINVKGVMYGTQVASRHMVPKRRGHIVNIASLAGVAPIMGLAIYSGAKYAVRAFSIAAAYELRRHGVYVTAVCPDGVDTPLLHESRKHEAAAMIYSSGRLLRIEDVTDIILRRVLRKKPLEAMIPQSRGWMARIANIFPQGYFTIGGYMRRRGQKVQARL